VPSSGRTNAPVLDREEGASSARRALRLWKSRDPMSRDPVAASDPDPVVTEHVVEEAREPDRTGGPAEQPIVERERHHLRLRLPLLVEKVEGVFHVREIVIARHEIRRIGAA
jgi:hypothetical protein